MTRRVRQRGRARCVRRDALWRPRRRAVCPVPVLAPPEAIPLRVRTTAAHGPCVRVLWRATPYGLCESALCSVSAETTDPAWWRARLPGQYVDVWRHPRGTATAEGLRTRTRICSLTPLDDPPPASILHPGASARVYVVVDGRPAALTATVRGVLPDGTVEVDVVPATMSKLSITLRR